MGSANWLAAVIDFESSYIFINLTHGAG